MGIIKFLKSTTGKTILGIVGALALIGLILPLISKEQSNIKKEQKEEIQDVEADSFDISGNTEPFVLKKEKKQAKAVKPKKKKTKLEIKPPRRPPVPASVPRTNKSNYNKKWPKKNNMYFRKSTTRSEESDILLDAGDDIEENVFISKRYAPYGRLISCKLVNCLESGNPGTPLIAIVTEDLWWTNSDGEKKLIIPAGTEVQGSANSGTPVRNRITTGNKFILIWNATSDMVGFELQLTGMALEKSNHPGNKGMAAISDMSAGIPGEVIANENLSKMLAYGLAFVQGLANGYQEEEVISNDSSVVVAQKATTQNAIAKGTENLAKLALQDISQQIAKDSYFVRIPPGTEFYLYVTQVIDLDKAKIANTLLDQEERKRQAASSRFSKSFRASSVLNKFSKK